MNLLFCKINFHCEDKDIKQDNAVFDNGFIRLVINRINVFLSDGKTFFYHKGTSIVCGIIGYISNLEDIKSEYSISHINDCEIIEAFYSIKKEDFIYELDGVFTIIIVDLHSRKGFIFRDKYGSNLPLYYTLHDDILIVSTSLKKILNELPSLRELNVSAAHDFVFCENHIIPNKSTLVKGINKLLPNQYIYFNRAKNGIVIKRMDSEKAILKKSYLESNLIASIRKSIKSLFGALRNNTVSCTLSGGFDTTIILHFLTEFSQYLITAFTIGGKNKNEIPQASLTASYYKNVVHKACLINENVLELLPYIVWLTEGYVNEKGIFLQYKNAEEIAKNNKKCIFIGEGADQVLDQYRFSRRILLKNKFTGIISADTKRKIKSYANKCLPKHRAFVIKSGGGAYTEEELELIKKAQSRIKKVSHDEMLEFILKKNGIMFNNFGIEGILPFLNKDIERISKSLWKLNRAKEYYKKEVAEIIAPEISINLKKIGGNTDIEYLFEKKSNLIQHLLEKDFTKTILGKHRVDLLLKHPSLYTTIILRLLMLYIFNELFILKKTDLMLHNSTFNIQLTDLLNEGSSTISL